MNIEASYLNYSFINPDDNFTEGLNLLRKFHTRPIFFFDPPWAWAILVEKTRAGSIDSCYKRNSCFLDLLVTEKSEHWKSRFWWDNNQLDVDPVPPVLGVECI